MSFRLVTMNNLERHNGWLKIRSHFLPRKCSPKDLFFSYISLMAIFAEVTENEYIIHSHLRDNRLSDSVR